MKEIKLDTEAPEPPKWSPVDLLNLDYVGSEFYVHLPNSTAPMMYFITSSREEADELAKGHPDAEIFIREVGEWRAVS